MKKVEQKKGEKRRAILNAAQEVFRTDGYTGASMDTIAQHAGVTKQTVYRYFNSKEALFRASLENQREGGTATFLLELERTDTHEALSRFALEFLKIHMSEAHLAGIRLLLSEGPESPEMTRAYFALGPEKTEARLEDFVRERFQTDDPEYAVTFLISTLLSKRMRVLIGLHAAPTPEELANHAERTVAFFMKLMTPSRDPSRN